MKLIRVTTVPMALKVLLRGQMKYMASHGFDVIMVSADGIELEDVKKYEGVRHECIHMTRQITPLADLRSLWKLYRFFKKERPDIVHSHTPKAGLLAMMAGRMAGVPVRIHTIAGLRFMTSTGFTRRILVAMEKITGRMATHVWPNSNSLRSYVVEQKLVTSRKLDMVGKGSSNGIDLDRFSRSALKPERIGEVKKIMHYDPACTYITAVGRIVKDKGIAELTQAFIRIYEQDKTVRLVLVGSFEEHLDPLDGDTMQFIKTHPAVILAGWHDDVEYFMAQSDLFIHPSYREGFPNVVLQAGAMECGVLVSRIPGNVDIVDDQENGFIFAVQDAEDLYQKLNQALREPQRMKELGQELRKKIEANFDRRYVQDQLRQKYEALLAASGKSNK